MTMRSMPPASSHLAESPVPAPPPMMGSRRRIMPRNRLRMSPRGIRGMAYLAPAAAGAGSRQISPKAATRASTNWGSFTLCGSRTILRLDVARTPETMASKSARSAAGSQKGLPGASMRTHPRRG